jgi:hypothetical protein
MRRAEAVARNILHADPRAYGRPRLYLDGADLGPDEIRNAADAIALAEALELKARRGGLAELHELAHLARAKVDELREAAEAIALEQNLEVEKAALRGELGDVGDGFAAGAQVDYHYANISGPGEIAVFDVEGHPVYTLIVGFDKRLAKPGVIEIRKGVNEDEAWGGDRFYGLY